MMVVTRSFVPASGSVISRALARLCVISPTLDSSSSTAIASSIFSPSSSSFAASSMAEQIGRACENVLFEGERGRLEAALRGDAPTRRSRGDEPSSWAVELRSTRDGDAAGTEIGVDACSIIPPEDSSSSWSVREEKMRVCE